ncbi:hypothetical protein ACFQMF_04210 [Halorubrum rutilum]|uniref:Cell surface glycoprotein n=1 Tax=Halorubrum rutilum TaxID=1364933 RepID=A0ABD6AHK4_9EURY|nr:hypothetical protein [Halorubrum rutilum]
MSGGLVRTAETDRIPVIAQSNFEDAEQLKLTVETPAGLDITDEVIDGPRVRQETDNGEPAAVQTATNRAHEPRGPAATRIHGSTQSKSNHGATGLAGLHATPIETQTQTETPIEASRTVTNTNLEQGGSTTVTITATVGSAGRIGISEEFSPAVRSAEIQSLTVNDESVVPLVAAADETGVAVAYQDLTPGDTVTVEYTLGVGDNDQTYEITGEVSSGSQEIELEETTIVAGTGTSGTISAGGFVRWDVALDSVEASALQITVTGSDDLQTDDAQVQSTVSITDGEPSLSLESASASRGTTTGITVQNGSGGATYTTAIPAADIRSQVEKDDYYQIFRNVGDTEQIGLVTDEQTYTDGAVPDEAVRAVYATVQIDPDDAAGATEIRTRFLADTADVFLSREPQPTPTGFDTATLTVMDTSVSLREPQVYTTGAQTTIAGTASAGVDAVALYVRTERGFELIDLDGENGQRDAQIDVSGSSFSADEIKISSGDLPGNDILSLPGQYQVGVVPVAAVQRTTSNESLPTRVPAPVFLNRNVNTTGLTVRNGNLTLTRAGQNQTIATTTTDLSVAGQATGSEQILVALVGARGTIQTEIISTDGPTFTDTVTVGDVAAGEATLYAISTGRDGIVGDGQLPGADTDTETTLTGVAAYLNQRVTGGMTPAQAADVILSQTRADVGSDDRVVTERIQVSQPRITITNVTTEGQTGQALRIRGSTNNRPSETSLLVTLRQNTEIRQRTQVSSWAAGRWNVSLDTSNLSAGRYVVVAETINADDRQRFRLNTTAQTTTVTMTQSARPRGVDSAPKTTTVQPPTDSQSPTVPQSVPSIISLLITRVNGFGFGIFSYILSILLYGVGYRVLTSAT